MQLAGGEAAVAAGVREVLDLIRQVYTGVLLLVVAGVLRVESF